MKNGGEKIKLIFLLPRPAAIQYIDCGAAEAMAILRPGTMREHSALRKILLLHERNSRLLKNIPTNDIF
jgi:hypothetical protein